MKDYFIQLFNYDQYANHKIAETILQANAPQKPVQLVAHLLTAEQVWLRRCKGEYQVNVVLWPEWDVNNFAAIITETHDEWLKYLNTLTAIDFERSITYLNFAGIEYTMRITDIIAHVINHGTHTRAQAGVYLKQAGTVTLPITDLAYYINTVI